MGRMWLRCGFGLGLVMAGTILLGAQSRDAPIQHGTGLNVVPMYEGWYENPDGTIAVAFSYMNRNWEESLDIPVGPNNRIEPGPPDQGQPTHFLPRAHIGVFAVTLPKGSREKEISWTLTSRGQTVTIPATLRPDYAIDALREGGHGNTPPVLKFDPEGASGAGPAGPRAVLTQVFPNPVTLDAWVTDDGKARTKPRPGQPLARVTWSKYRGPGIVTFSNATPPVDKAVVGQFVKSTTTATFSAPGKYLLRVLVNDTSDISFHCCWTNGYVEVNVESGR